MPKNKKPRKKKYAFSAKKSVNNTKKLVDKAVQQSLVLQQQGKVKEALEITKQGLEQAPNNITLLTNAGAFAGMLGQLDLAKKCILSSLKLNPNNALSHNNLGNLFKEQKQFEKAKEHYQIVLKLNPNYVEAHNNLGSLFQAQKYFDKAKEHYQSVLKLNPNYVDAQWNLSLLQLMLSNFSQGWQGHESRYHPDRKDRSTIPSKTLIPQYQGEDLNGKNLVIYPEQGFGDEIQFIRYLPLLKKTKG